MGFERDLSPVAPILLVTNGGTEGQITLATTLGLFVKQLAQLKATGVTTLTVQIKRVLSLTQILVGLPGNPLDHRVNVSAFTTALGANLSCTLQDKSTLPMESRLFASYIQEPSNSWRVTPVDSFGNSFDPSNPVPITGDINVTSVQLFNLPYDSIQASYPSGIQEIYSSYLGGLGGTLQQTVTVDYVDSTKNLITTVVRTPPG